MKQDYKRIEELIERFFEGQTSNEEERELYNFFSSDNVPKHLLPYRQVFAYFESGINEEEPNHQEIERKNMQSTRNGKIRMWASIAASLLIFISLGIYHFTREKEFNPYEGSYIIRNGIKITDPKIVNPEIEKALYFVKLQEKTKPFSLQLHEINQGDSYEQIMGKLKQQQLKWLEQIDDEDIRNELTEILNLKL